MVSSTALEMLDDQPIPKSGAIASAFASGAFTADGGRYEKDVDIMGVKRGMHEKGAEKCPCYAFHPPGRIEGVWGWNDTTALFCATCGDLATSHVIISLPVIDDYTVRVKEQQALQQAQQQARKQAQYKAAAHSAIAPEERLAQQSHLEEPNVDDGMLHAGNDPLAFNAPKPKLRPPPPERAESLSSIAIAPAPVGLEPTLGGDTEQSPELRELLARDHAANEAFKREVDKMVQEELLKEQLQKRELERAAASTTSNDVAKTGTFEEMQTVSPTKFADSSVLLHSVGLPQYQAAFDEQAMEPETLVEVLRQQGREALDEALKELGIKMGHRLKIINAMIIH